MTLRNLINIVMNGLPEWNRSMDRELVIEYLGDDGEKHEDEVISVDLSVDGEIKISDYLDED